MNLPRRGFLKGALAPMVESESVNFQNAISGTPVCCPYRASLMAGQYPLTSGVYINDMELRPRDVTLGETFKNAGYRNSNVPQAFSLRIALFIVNGRKQRAQPAR